MVKQSTSFSREPKATGILVFVLLLAGCGSPGPAVKVPARPADFASAEPDFTMDATAWYLEWKENRDAALKKYYAKVVELSGIVIGTSDDPYGRVGYVYLMVKDEPGGVKCATQEKEPWLRVGPGSTIKVRGRPATVRPNGDLDPAIIVESGPNTCLTISAVQLTQELAANRDAAIARYHNRWLIVDGEVATRNPHKEGGFTLGLKGDGGMEVLVGLGKGRVKEEQQRMEAIILGQKLKVCGQALLSANQKFPTLHMVKWSVVP